MFTWKKDRANISDEEPTFHVRYLGSTETFIPVGPGCTSRHVQKLWDNAPSERNLKRVSVKLGLGGIWLKGAPPQGKLAEGAGKDTKVKKGLRQQNLEHEISENDRLRGEDKGDKDHVKKRGGENDGDKKSKGKSNSSTVRHFKMEDVSFCAADKSTNDRIFCWISRCDREAGCVSEGRVGPLEVHAVLCSTVDKAQTMAAVMSRAFQLAYKDWRAEQQRETRKQQQKKISGVNSDVNDAENEGWRARCDEREEFSLGKNENREVFAHGELSSLEHCNRKGKWLQEVPNDKDSFDAAKSRQMSMSSSCSASSLSSTISQRSSVSSMNSSPTTRTGSDTRDHTNCRQ